MKRTSLLVSAVLLLLSLSLLLPAPQDAGATIVVTGGSLEVPLTFRIGGSPLSLTSDERGFSLSAVGGTGVFLPGGLFRPGDPISLRAEWSGMDLDGSFTIDGVTYGMGAPALGLPCPPFPACDGSGLVDFEGIAVAPAADDLTSSAVVAPFTFRGQIMWIMNDAPLVLNSETLTGEGTATIGLTRCDTSLSLWCFRSASYDFQTPVPEPSTLLLLGSGLAGLGGLAWRRNRKG